MEGGNGGAVRGMRIAGEGCGVRAKGEGVEWRGGESEPRKWVRVRVEEWDGGWQGVVGRGERGQEGRKAGGGGGGGGRWSEWV